MKNKAFTLIELLVVVLIIGILAAVALPQYQTAVNKSRYAGLMPLAKSVKDAEEAQLMATGHYTSKLEDLSVQVPGTIDDNTATTDHVTIELYNGDGNYDFVKATDTRNPANTYVMYFAKSGNFKGEIHCEAEQNNDKAKQLCLSYGPTAGPFTGTDSGYDAYVLQGTGDGTGSGVSNILRGFVMGAVVSWDSDDGESWQGYDENGRVIVNARYCVGSDRMSDCDSIDVFSYEEDRQYSRTCTLGTATAGVGCKDGEYENGYNVINSDDFRSILTCADIDSSGNCTDYSSARAEFLSGEYTTNEEFGGTYEIWGQADCSAYDANGCTVFSSMYVIEPNSAETIKHCGNIEGTSCLEWVYDYGDGNNDDNDEE